MTHPVKILSITSKQTFSVIEEDNSPPLFFKRGDFNSF